MKRAFEVWSMVTQLNFTEVSRNGNIKIDFVRGEHGDGYSFDGPGKILAHALLPPYGLIHFDADEKWAALIVTELSRYDTIDLLPTAIHEIGHVLGLEHSWEKGSIMSPVYHYQSIDVNGEYVKPKLTNFDILRIQKLYGYFSLFQIKKF
uniref:ZnMc domain-containing protein n=1 Tax=Elaeophora elaphi TaxID=1147741 RepID=A0A0R3S274_9BILA